MGPTATPTFAPAPSGLGSTPTLTTRTAVLNPDLQVVAYEIALHGRDGSGRLGPGNAPLDGGSFVEALETLAGQRPANLRVSSAAALSTAADALPSDRVALVLPASAAHDPEVMRAATTLAGRSHAIVVEGIRTVADAGPLLELAAAVKIDLGDLDPSAVEALVNDLRAGSDRPLIASGVDTTDQRELAGALGFDLFQGFFFGVPAKGEGAMPSSSRVHRMRLLAALQDPTVDFDELAKVISHDVGLSYGLLKLVNSAFFGLPRQIEAIRDAAVLLGMGTIRRWATLATVADLDEKAEELIVTALTRARMCELLSAHDGAGDGEAYFTTGLFSLIDALMDASPVELLAELPLSVGIAQAILAFEGLKGRALRNTIAWERGLLAEVTPPSGMATEEMQPLYLAAVEWAESATAGLA